MTQVAIVGSPSYADVYAAIEKGIELIGGIDDIISPGKRVLLKPNLLSAKPPERGITTHPAVVSALVDIVREYGAVPAIGDSSGAAYKGVERVWKNTGMLDVARSKDVELVNFETSGITLKEAFGFRFPVSSAVFDFDVIVDIPRFKSHSFVSFTGAVKNMYGVIPGLGKTEGHKRFPLPDEFGRMLAALYSVVKPHLVVMDAVTVMEGNGPASGELRHYGKLFVSTDGVAVDTVALTVAGYKKSRVPTYKWTKRFGLGETELDRIELVGDSLGESYIHNFKKPSTSFYGFVPPFLPRLLAPLVRIRPAPVIGKCKNCLVCASACPVNAISPGREVPIWDYKKCILCLCCHEMCPEDAIELKMSPLARLISR